MKKDVKISKRTHGSSKEKMTPAVTFYSDEDFDDGFDYSSSEDGDELPF